MTPADHLLLAWAAYAANPHLTYAERRRFQRLIDAALGLLGEPPTGRQQREAPKP